ncbi:MAG TPA: NADH-quinone oxidoreductase subunit A [Solirubrobacterales bacterium]|nr:NADH-quinone oxidoreductase subunit A [Solirubrobacterales bacterium]
MLKTYLPVLVFAGLGIVVGTALAMLNRFVGPKRPNPVKSDPYECGLPTEVSRTFRFGVSFYMTAMLFILFDLEVIFLFPVATLIAQAESLYVLGASLVFIFLLVVALVYEWAKGGLEWK